MMVVFRVILGIMCVGFLWSIGAIIKGIYEVFNTEGDCMLLFVLLILMGVLGCLVTGYNIQLLRRFIKNDNIRKHNEKN